MLTTFSFLVLKNVDFMIKKKKRSGDNTPHSANQTETLYQDYNSMSTYKINQFITNQREKKGSYKKKLSRPTKDKVRCFVKTGQCKIYQKSPRIIESKH